jgi:elongator complex protein 3
MNFYSEIIDLILADKIHSKEELHKAKVKLCKKYNLKIIPPDSEILACLPDNFSEDETESLVDVLRKKPMRTISGVAIVAVMTSPENCPHGLCIPCPGGPESGTPQSYTGHEPAALRASLNDFDPYLQTKNRISQLQAIGHPTDKIDLIIMGGTFTARSPYYQEWFVKRCFDALNGEESSSLDEAKKKNENASSRCIGLTVETRPDWFRLRHCDMSLSWGATRVELGVQTVYDDILYEIRRGHTVLDSILATRIAKNTGLKVCYHIMLGLPGSNIKRDIDSFLEIFENSDFKPDMIKIYPTLTIKGTKLYDLWKSGEYEPLSTERAAKLVAELKTYVPEWVRIQRIQRDVPVQFIDAGVDKSNLRQLVNQELKEHGRECRCIRCREIGHKSLKEKIQIDEENIGLNTIFYEASESEEVFISLVEEKYDALIGFLRLRDINDSHRSELDKDSCMIIRELRVVGRELPIGKKSIKGVQHKGFGKELIDEAERICYEEYDKKNLFVISGVGVKEYYRNLGFEDSGVYLSKKITS